MDTQDHMVRFLRMVHILMEDIGINECFPRTFYTGETFIEHLVDMEIDSYILGIADKIVAAFADLPLQAYTILF